MPNSVLIKSSFRGAVAEAILNDITNKTNRFFYFFGRPDTWDLDYSPAVVNDSFKNELDTRADMVYIKQLSSTDACLVVKRIDWKVDTIFDRFDDAYSTELIGINLISGGTGYTVPPLVTIAGTGTGAIAVADISTLTGRVIGVRVTSRGTGYVDSVSNPLTIGFVSTDGSSGALATGVISTAQGNIPRLEDSKYYVLTDDFNVYACIDNAGGIISTEKPYGTANTVLTTSDGYKWKYLYTLPLALRTKFLSSTYMPVTTSLKAQFYSGGAINSVNIDSGGAGYSNLTKIVVSGDGYSADNPLFIRGGSIAAPTYGGVGYTTATALIDPPAGGPLASNGWITGKAYVVGQYVSYIKNVYQIDIGGTSNIVPPTHTSGSVVNGASFKYVGTNAEATLTVAGGAITAVTMLQGVSGVNITNGGNFYANGPNTMTFSSGAATGVSYAQNGVIYRVDIINKALNSYTTLPTITSFGGGGSGAVGTVLGQSGAGYAVVPNVSVSGTGTITTTASVTVSTEKSNAAIYPIISSDKIVGIQIVDPGVGYSTASLVVTGTGVGAKLTPNVLIGDVSALQSNIELTSIAGAIYVIPVISGGYGYANAPDVKIVGDGINATATATVVSGVVTEIVVVNPGSGYHTAEVLFASTTGVGASARVIIEPYGGISKNAVRTLKARTLMIHANVSKDQVNGLNLATEYRQFGLLRNPYAYNDDSQLTASISTACWTIYSTTTVSGFKPGIVTNVPITNSVSTTVATVASGTTFTVANSNNIIVGMSMYGIGVVAGTTVTGIVGTQITVSTPIAGLTNGYPIRFNFIKTYRIIIIKGMTVLMQSLQNSVPVIGDIFNYDGNILTAAAVTPPTFDKYSGELLYQDNQIPFKPVDNTSEKITISTVLKF